MKHLHLRNISSSDFNTCFHSSPTGFHSRLVHDRLPRLRLLPGLPEQRSLRSAAGSSGSWCSSVAEGCRCRGDSGPHEHPRRAAGCCGRVRVVQDESDGDKVRREDEAGDFIQHKVRVTGRLHLRLSEDTDAAAGRDRCFLPAQRSVLSASGSVRDSRLNSRARRKRQSVATLSPSDPALCLTTFFPPSPAH